MKYHANYVINFHAQDHLKHKHVYIGIHLPATETQTLACAVFRWKIARKKHSFSIRTVNCAGNSTRLVCFFSCSSGEIRHRNSELIPYFDEYTHAILIGWRWWSLRAFCICSLCMLLCTYAACDWMALLNSAVQKLFCMFICSWFCRGKWSCSFWTYYPFIRAHSKLEIHFYDAFIYIR